MCVYVCAYFCAMHRSVWHHNQTQNSPILRPLATFSCPPSHSFLPPSWQCQSDFQLYTSATSWILYTRNPPVWAMLGLVSFTQHPSCCIRVVCFFVAEWYSMVWTYHLSFLHHPWKDSKVIASWGLLWITWLWIFACSCVDTVFISLRADAQGYDC